MTVTNWLLYGGLTGLLLTVAAWQGSRSLVSLRRGSRWCWLLAGLATALLPLVGLVRSPEPTGRLLPLGPAWAWPAALSVAPTAVVHSGPTRTGLPPVPARQLALLAWAIASIAALSWVIRSQRSLARRRRGWHRETLLGTPVSVSPDLGPAVVGVRRPEIVVPEWVTRLPPEELELVLRHECEHLRCNDSRLLGAMLSLIVLAPWHPFLWLQLRGLRLALELDCDRRVLAARPDVRGYATLLLGLAERIASERRAGAWVLPLATLWSRRSSLERRIQAMAAGRPGGRSRLAAGAGGAVAVALLLLACGARPPVSAPVPAAPAPALGVGPDSTHAGRRPASPVDSTSQVDDAELLRQLDRYFTRPVVATDFANSPVYWFVADTDGTLVRHDSSSAEVVRRPARYVRNNMPFLLERARALGDTVALHQLESYGTLVLSPHEVYRQYPELIDRTLLTYQMSRLRFGANTVTVVWVRLAPA
jgi:Zn-dependent protease with chaperone function